MTLPHRAPGWWRWAVGGVLFPAHPVRNSRKFHPVDGKAERGDSFIIAETFCQIFQPWSLIRLQKNWRHLRHARFKLHYRILPRQIFTAYISFTPLILGLNRPGSKPLLLLKWKQLQPGNFRSGNYPTIHSFLPNSPTRVLSHQYISWSMGSSYRPAVMIAEPGKTISPISDIFLKHPHRQAAHRWLHCPIVAEIKLTFDRETCKPFQHYPSLCWKIDSFLCNCRIPQIFLQILEQTRHRDDRWASSSSWLSLTIRSPFFPQDLPH